MKIGETIYFDHQASTPIDQHVLDEMRPFFTGRAGNPHSTEHAIGWRAARAVDEAAAQVATMIGSDQDEIIFTSGATEANNLALLGIGRRAESGGRRRILLGETEHKCIHAIGRILRDNFGFEINKVPVDKSGYVNLDALNELLSDDVLLVSLMAVNNEIGTVQDMAAISEIVQHYGAILHCDAAQAPCATDLTKTTQHVDLMSLSGHKMYGPMGIGALFVRRELQSLIEPIIYGGGQQNGIRSGTLPTPLVVGFGAAAKLMAADSAKANRASLRQLTTKFANYLRDMPCPVWFNGPDNPSLRHPGNINVGFAGISAADLLDRVQPNLAASTGSACTSGFPEPSHVLTAIGLSGKQASSCIRFSLGIYTTEEDVINAAEIIRTAIENLIEGDLLDIA